MKKHAAEASPTLPGATGRHGAASFKGSSGAGSLAWATVAKRSIGSGAVTSPLHAPVAWRGELHVRLAPAQIHVTDHDVGQGSVAVPLLAVRVYGPAG